MCLLAVSSGSREACDWCGRRVSDWGVRGRAVAGLITFGDKGLPGRSARDHTVQREEQAESQKQANPKAAWSAVSRVLMNLDEFITRE